MDWVGRCCSLEDHRPQPSIRSTSLRWGLIDGSHCRGLVRVSDFYITWQPSPKRRCGTKYNQDYVGSKPTLKLKGLCLFSNLEKSFTIAMQSFVFTKAFNYSQHNEEFESVTRAESIHLLSISNMMSTFIVALSSAATVAYDWNHCVFLK